MAVDERMLKALGIKDVEDLFRDIPVSVRTDGIHIPKGMSEPEVIRYVRDMLSKNRTSEDHPCFLGGGVRDHFIPSAVRSIISRSEFVTSYTPYQAEISQGMLQAIFEYQSLIAELTDMDVVNSSMYDAPTALGEAATMSFRIRSKKKFLVPEAMSFEKKLVLRNYVLGLGMEVVEYAYDPYTGGIDMADLASKLDDDVSGVYAEVPNLFGVIDPLVMRLKEEVKDRVLVIGVDPISLGALVPPGQYGADIVVGEGQPLGVPMNFGGPLLGIFACRQEHVRKMPGRLIGMTKDKQGRRAYCMTLQTREQHIKRSKATSNICSNEALLAVAAAAYLSIVGPKGLRGIAKTNILRARSLAERIDELDGFTAPVFHAYHFNEFVMTTPVRPEKLSKILLKHGIIGGMPMSRHVPRMADEMLIATTEMHSEDDHERLIKVLKEVA
ncbi:MAG: aminomethyl-transferring glycine dehydrogenase subunit GcvPA [Methanomassiliicoccales archaeon]|nr:MAG: aminomethyl-transferring glycine dehydrogenase subunit GcvPA [Methanomassiliicoccales archaeon]